MNVPLVPDTDTLNQILRTKLLYEHAYHHSKINSEIDDMIAIHNLDNSVEYFLRIIASSINYEDLTDKSFPNEMPNMLGDLKKVLKEKYSINMKYLIELKKLREIRNLVQHGNIHIKTDLNKFFTIVERFFSHLTIEIFNVTIDELSKSSLIENITLKKLFIDLEKSIQENKFSDSIIISKDIYDNFMYLDKGLTYNLKHYLPILIKNIENGNVLKYFFENLTNQLDIQHYGLDRNNYEKFLDYMKYVPNETAYVILQRDWKKDDSIFCLNFMFDLIIKFQKESSVNDSKNTLDTDYRFYEELSGIDIFYTPVIEYPLL